MLPKLASKLASVRVVACVGIILSWVCAVSYASQGSDTKPAITPATTALPVLRDADGKEWQLNYPGRVTAVILNTERTARHAREMGKALYPFQGRDDFRALVIVNLDESLGKHARPITILRIRQDLDAEARRIAPYYKKNGNSGNPRDDIGAVADFDGRITRSLGFSSPHTHLRVLIFDKNGKIAARFDPANSPNDVYKKVQHLLGIKP